MPAFNYIFLLLGSGLGAVSQGPDEKLPTFTVETVTETRRGCALVALADDATLRVEQAATRLTLTGLIEMRQESQALPPLPMRDFVLFNNGDRLPLDPNASASLDESRLFVWPAKSLGKAHEKGMSLYVPNVVLIFWTVPEGVDDAELFFAKLAEEPRKRDVVFLKNGDRIEGAVTALGGKAGCVVTTDGRQVPAPWSKLAGIAWKTDRQSRLRAKKTYFHAVLDGGARLNFTQFGFDEQSRRWTGKTQIGPALDLPAAGILALDVRQGPAVDLADLTPTRYEQHPYLGVSWPLVKDAAVTGHPLRLGGSTYDKGLGMHAACEVAYKLDGKFQRFESLVGFDETLSRRGRARLAVMLDGKRVELHEGKELTSRDPPLKVSLDVRGVREMTLLVELGSFGDVQAHVNWANARLIKRE
jgi:hypothetical protein